jgi:hypothetical protein
MEMLLSEFGDNKTFIDTISATFLSRTWSGSLIPYLEDDKKLILPLIEHPNSKVKNWAFNFTENIDRQVEYEMTRDAEEDMLRS